MDDLPRDPALDGLDALVGDWYTEGTHPMMPDGVRGRATFSWLDGRRFLIWRSEATAPVPSAIAIIGGGDTPGVWPVHYFDSRGVERVYQTSFADGVWKMWRDHPAFSQRMTGRFDADGTLRVTGELQQDGPWKPDLSLVYRRR